MMDHQAGFVRESRPQNWAGLTQKLGRALDWAALLRDSLSACPINERDVIAIGLIAQNEGISTVHCAESALLNNLPVPEWLTLHSLAGSSADEAKLILAPSSAVESFALVRYAEAGDVVLLYGVRNGAKVAAGDSRLFLAMIDPALWNSGLALLVPTNHEHVDSVAARLRATLGDQSLDPLALYEEVSRLRAAVRVPDSQRTAEQDLKALRRFVRGLIERAALAARRESARAKPGVVVDWSSAFYVTPEIGKDDVASLGDAEVRARRARIEAEFLRGQLRSLAVPREVNHHDLIAMSGFFDIVWYSEKYDVAYDEAIKHYIEIGHLQMNDPSPYFSTGAYFAAHPEVRSHGFNPLLHYLMDGIYEGRAVELPTEN